MASIFTLPADDASWAKAVLEGSTFDWNRLRPYLTAKGISTIVINWAPEGADGSAGDDGRVYAIRPGRQTDDVCKRILLHEIFHIADKVDYVDHQAVRDIIGIGGLAWIEPEWYGSPGEWFADAAACAFGPAGTQNTSPYWDQSYAGRMWGWDGTDRLARLRALIQPTEPTEPEPIVKHITVTVPCAGADSPTKGQGNASADIPYAQVTGVWPLGIFFGDAVWNPSCSVRPTADGKTRVTVSGAWPGAQAQVVVAYLE